MRGPLDGSRWMASSGWCFLYGVTSSVSCGRVVSLGSPGGSKYMVVPLRVPVEGIPLRESHCGVRWRSPLEGVPLS